MNVGQLFISLGIKGTEKVVGALGGTTKGLKEVRHQALFAVAGLTAAFYATSRLFESSNKTGQSLTNFSAELEMSAKALQQYQYAGKLVGVSNEEMISSFKQIQSLMTDVKMNKPNWGIGIIRSMTGAFGPEDINEFSKNPEKAMQAIQKFMNMNVDAGFKNKVLEDIGLGGLGGAFKRQAFDQKKIDAAPYFSDKQIKNLDSANQSWIKMFDRIERSVAKFNASNGPQLADSLAKIIDALIRFGETITGLAQKFGIFQSAADSIGILDDLAGGKSKGLSGVAKELYGSDDFKSKLKALLNFAAYSTFGIYTGMDNNPIGEHIDPKNAVLPKELHRSNYGNTEKTNNININQNFNGPADPAKVKEATTNGVKNAFSSSQRNQGN